MLIDRNRNIKVEHQVTKLTSFPDNPQLNKAELCATAKGFESVVKNLTGLIDGTNVVVNIQGRRISKLTLDIEAFSLELSKYYTIGETETYVGSQIKAESDRIDLVVSSQQNHINTLTGEVEEVSSQAASLQLQSDSIKTTVENHTGSISTLTQTTDNFAISFKTISVSGYTRTGKTAIDAAGLTVYDGALKIYDSSSALVFDASKDGSIYAKGEFYTSGTFNGSDASTSLVSGGLKMYDGGNSASAAATLYCNSSAGQIALSEIRGYEIVVAHKYTMGETWFSWAGVVKNRFTNEGVNITGYLDVCGNIKGTTLEVANDFGFVVNGHTFYCNMSNILGVDRYFLIANP